MTKFQLILKAEQEKIKLKALIKQTNMQYKKYLSSLDAIRTSQGLSYDKLAQEAGLSNRSAPHRLLTNHKTIRDLTPIEKVLLKKLDR